MKAQLGFHLNLKKSPPLTIITSVGAFWKIVLFIGAAVRQDSGPKQGWPVIPMPFKEWMDAFGVLR